MARTNRVGTSKSRAPAPIDPHPRVNGSGSKCTLTLSATTVLRRREPTADDHIARNMTNMVWDYSEQRHVWPNGRPSALIEATQSTGGTKYDTINKSGHPFALGRIMVGGAPDNGGHPLGTQAATRKKMFK